MKIIGRAAWHNGSSVYWHRANGDTVPARVTGVSKNGKRVQIEANCVEGTRVVTVSESKLSRQ